MEYMGQSVIVTTLQVLCNSQIKHSSGVFKIKEPR